MDPLGDLLNGARARGAVVHQVFLEPPWSLRIAEGAPLTLVTAARGWAWVVPDDAEPWRIDAGDVAIVCGVEPYTVGDAPGTPPQWVVRPGNRCTTLDGRDVDPGLRVGPRSCALMDAGSTLLVSGTYHLRLDVSERLLTVLPRVLVVPRDRLARPVMDVLLAEIDRVDPGQQIVLDRLLDLLLVVTLRGWFAMQGVAAPGWYRALSDPVVGAALRLLHDRPAERWTLAELAEHVGASRATLARRFADLVGEPPMTYLTRWRMALAADLLSTTDAKLDAIAARVGYADGLALSAAFRRTRGISPSTHRGRSVIRGADDEPQRTR